MIEVLLYTKLTNRNSYGLSNNDFYLFDNDSKKIKIDGVGYPGEFYNKYTKKFASLLRGQDQWLNPLYYQILSNPGGREYYEKVGFLPENVFKSQGGR
jgi:hypothetical protein